MPEEERVRLLELVKEGKLSVEDAVGQARGSSSAMAVREAWWDVMARSVEGSCLCVYAVTLFGSAEACSSTFK